MQSTNGLGLNIIEESDPIEPEPLNENTSILEDMILGLLTTIEEMQTTIDELGSYTGMTNEPEEPDEGDLPDGEDEPDEGEQPDEGDLPDGEDEPDEGTGSGTTGQEGDPEDENN